MLFFTHLETPIYNKPSRFASRTEVPKQKSWF